MSGLGSKTPVSKLQEYLVSQGKLPQYALTRNGVGTHNPEFTYRVQVGIIWEEGTGRSKQEAKHRAAEKMLRSLKVIDTKEEEEESESNSEPAENYVGQLKNLCINMHYPEPKYYLEESAGPAHSKTFKMVCCVSQLKDFGIGRTKKQAKHLAAFAMLQRLKEVCNKKEVDFPNQAEVSKEVVPPFLTDEEIIEKFNELKSTDLNMDKDPAALFRDNYKAYEYLPKMSPTISNLLKERKLINKENSPNLIKVIATELGVALNATVILSNKPDANFIVYTLATFPPAAGIGFGETNAAFNLLNSLLYLCS